VDFAAITGKLIIEVDGATHTNAKKLTHDKQKEHAS
jgi:very-short-patch-repair endonuclease